MQSGAFQRVHAHCACAGASFSPASTRRKYERSRPFVVTHLALELDVLFDDRAVEGQARLELERRAPRGKELVLDAVGFSLRGLSLQLEGGSERTLLEGTDYSYDGDQLSIVMPDDAQRGTLKIAYRAVPLSGLYFLAPDDKVKDRPLQVWSQCQDEDGRHWFPCLDKPHVKMTTEMRVTVPQGMTALSNGELVEQDTPKKGSRWLYHYKLDVPHPSYLMTLVIGQFDEWTENVALPSGRDVPLRYMVPVGKKADGHRAFQGTAEMIRLFSEKTGVEYPWSRYTQIVVSDFIFGGMENTTATTMYEHILFDKKAALDIESHDLVAHELAHQWFGDLVTCRDWSHAWLNEGFATFMELVEREARLGRDEYDQAVVVDLVAYLGEANHDYKRPIVSGDYEEPIDLFDRHLYQKGGLVLHMLRRRLGDECFWAGVRAYLQKHRGGIVETRDLIRELEEASGQSLERFFDQWVFRPGHPEIDVKVSYADGLLLVDVEQTQTGADVATFELAFEIAVRVGGEWQTHARLIDDRKASLVVRTNERPTGLVIDPDFRIAAPLTLNIPADLLRKTVRNGASARGRAQAADALKKRQDPDVIEALERCLLDANESWIVRATAAASLGSIGAQGAEKALVSAASTEDAKVRRAVATALGQFQSAETVETLGGLAHDDASYLVSAAAARSLGRTRVADAPTRLRPLLKRDSWADVVRAGALDGMAASGNEEFLPELFAWSEYGRPLRARRAAIAALAVLGEGKKVREHLGKLLRDRDPHLRTGILLALERLGDPKARGVIEERLAHELDGRVIRRGKKTMAALGSDRAQAIQKTREETQLLEKELGDLKTRLSRLEQSLAPAKKGEESANEPAADSGSKKSAGPSKKSEARTADDKKKESRQKPGSAQASAHKSAPKKTSAGKSKTKRTR